MNLEDFIAHELAKRLPARLLPADEHARHLAHVFLQARPEAEVTDEDSQGIALVLIGDSLAALEQTEAIRRLAVLMRRAPVVLAAARENAPLGFNDYLSLGMQRLYGPDSGQQCVYAFDLHSYKPAPDWLNPKYWAHPERWEP